MAQQQDNKPAVPWLLNLWGSLYRSLPRIYFPFTNHDVSVVLLGSIFLYGAKLVGLNLLIHVFGWPPEEKETQLAAMSVSSIVHSMTLVPALCVLLWNQPYVPSSKMSEAPQWWQDAAVAVLQFCTGYMLYDGIINIIIYHWERGLTGEDWMFLGHHFATSFYMTSTRVIGAGHISAFTCMLTGEATNPLHNSFYIASHAKELACCSGPLAKQITVVIEVLFSAFYVLFRTVIGPIFLTHVTYDILITKRGRQNIPLALRIIFSLMIWGVLIGSIPWVQECLSLLDFHLGDSPEDSKEL